MNTLEVGVLIAGAGLIALVLWFFFGEKNGPPAPHEGG